MINNGAIKLAIIIPVYNHDGALGYVLEQLQSYQLPCLLVDDGSDAKCQQVIEQMVMRYSWVSMIRLHNNQGKGAAVCAGLMVLERQGVTHAFQIDADGQHNLDDVPTFVAAAKENPTALVLGYAIYDESVPKARFYGRYVTHIWVWIETLSFVVKDTMCGFRIYPIQSTNRIIRSARVGQRMSFDTEIVVRQCWRHTPVVNIPTNVCYPYDGVSHFSVWRDNMQISYTHAKLFFGMLSRLPVWLFKKALGKR